MGIRDFIGLAAATLKQNAPNATPVKDACRISYAYGSTAFTKIDQTIRVNGLYQLGQFMPDDETKSKIMSFATVFAKNAGLYALQEGYKSIPGGVAFHKILSKTLNDVNHENLKVDHMAGAGGANMLGREGVESVSGDGDRVGSTTGKSPEYDSKTLNDVNHENLKVDYMGGAGGANMLGREGVESVSGDGDRVGSTTGKSPEFDE